MRASKLFRINKRTYEGKVVYYASFPAATGEWSPRKSTGCSTRAAAEKWCIEKITSGEVVGIVNGDTTLMQWCTGFWGVSGRYEQDRTARGFVVSPTYLENQRRNLEKHVLPDFGERKLHELTTAHLDKFFLNLFHKSGLSGSTINGIMRSLRVPLREAERLEHINHSPMGGVQQVASGNRVRGALTQEELDKLFKTVWEDRQAMIMCMLAAGCGLRHGEARAVRPKDIQDGILKVSQQWDRGSGSFKPPKYNSVREVPVPARLQAEIAAYVQEKGIPLEGVLSAGQIPTRPKEREADLEALRAALVKIGIPEKEQARNRRFLDLHALRHTYITRLRAGDVPDWQIMAVAGHKSLKMTDHYTHGKGSDYTEVAAAKIIPFAKIA